MAEKKTIEKKTAPKTKTKKTSAKKADKKAAAQGGQLRVTLLRSTIEAKISHKQCVLGLGLRRIRHTVTLADNPCIRGMINQVRHLVAVEEVSNAS